MDQGGRGAAGDQAGPIPRRGRHGGGLQPLARLRLDPPGGGAGCRNHPHGRAFRRAVDHRGRASSGARASACGNHRPLHRASGRSACRRCSRARARTGHCHVQDRPARARRGGQDHSDGRRDPSRPGRGTQSAQRRPGGPRRRERQRAQPPVRALERSLRRGGLRWPSQGHQPGLGAAPRLLARAPSGPPPSQASSTRTTRTPPPT